MTPEIEIKLTEGDVKEGKCILTLEVTFPLEEGAARDEAMVRIARLLRETLPTSEARAEFLAVLDQKAHAAGLLLNVR